MTPEQQLAEETEQTRKYRREAAKAEADVAVARSILANLLCDWEAQDELEAIREAIAEKLHWNREPGLSPELNNGTVTIDLDGDWTYLCRVCGGYGPGDTRWLATYLRSESTDRHVYEVKQTR